MSLPFTAEQFLTVFTVDSCNTAADHHVNPTDGAIAPMRHTSLLGAGRD